MAAFNLSLANLQIALEEAWQDPIQAATYKAKVEALRYQLARQTATFASPIVGSGVNAKRLTTTIYWPEICVSGVDSCTDICAVSTNEATDNSKNITLSCLGEKSFKESWTRFRTSPLQFAEVVAKQIIANDKAIAEWLVGQYILFLEANKGEHQYELPVGSDDSGDWTIAGTEWSYELMPEFFLAGDISKISNPYLLDGTNFFSQYWLAQQARANADGKGVANSFDQFDIVFDPTNMIANAPGKTYLVAPSAVAFVSGNYYGMTAEEPAPGHRIYKIQSRFLPGIYYDVDEIAACASNDFVTSWKMKLYGSFQLNPLGCDTDITGILAFEKTGI